MIRSTLALLLVVVFFSCSKTQPDVTPVQTDPTPEATLIRSFYDPTINVTGGVNHAPASVTALAQSNPTTIFVTVKSLPDELNMGIARTALSATWVGTYSLKCRPRPTNPVEVSYNYTEGDSGTRIYLLSSNAWNADLTGNLTITAYDATRQLISGTFSVSVPNQLRPEETSALQGKTTITTEGSFTNVKVKPIQ